MRVIIIIIIIINIIIIILLARFFPMRACRWSFIGVWVIASAQVSSTLLIILADLTYAVVWMVSIHPLISKSSSHLSKPLGIITSTPIIIGW